ncbi:MAG: DUF4377 domain-containing protein [Ardenticatenaceae bacterium]
MIRERYKQVIFYVLLMVFGVLLAACRTSGEVDSGAGETEVPEVPQTGSSYYVEELMINVMESFPVQVSAMVRGNLADGCTELENITPIRDGNTFELEVQTSHSGADGCIQVVQPFEQNVPLDVEGLPAGTYTVNLGDKSATFTLDVDNSASNIEESDVMITLERTACFGTCPIYTVTVYGDGRVEYEGTDYVDVTGAQSSNIGVGGVSQLVEAFAEAGYFEWNDAYTNIYVSDMPTVITSMTLEGQTKRIERYEGDQSAPLELVKLENLIDTSVNSAQWTGHTPVDPQQVGVPNPASEYCVEQGGTLEMRSDENGEYGVCVFPDGSECEEWAFLRGECVAGTATEETEETEETDETLAGTKWEFSWGEVDRESFAPFADQPITLDFSADQISGNGACNGFFGGYEVDGDTLTIGEMGVTAMACEPELMELERQFFNALQSANAFEHNTDSLTLTLPNGALHFLANMPVEKTLFVGPEEVDCQGVAPQKCYLVKDDPNGEWEYFYDQIVGFEWEAGYHYELRVRITPVENPPADASSVTYELIELISQTPA